MELWSCTVELSRSDLFPLQLSDSQHNTKWGRESGQGIGIEVGGFSREERGVATATTAVRHVTKASGDTKGLKLPSPQLESDKPLCLRDSSPEAPSWITVV